MFEILHQFWVWSGTVSAFIVCGWAFWRGGLAERVGAAIILGSWILSLLFHSPSPHDPGAFVISLDVVTMFALIWLSVWSRRIWTLFVAASQVDAVLTHLAAFATNYGSFSYITTVGIYGGWGLLIALGAGVYYHRRAVERGEIVAR